jgi:hypothetical protein
MLDDDSEAPITPALKKFHTAPGHLSSGLLTPHTKKEHKAEPIKRKARAKTIQFDNTMVTSLDLKNLRDKVIV